MTDYELQTGLSALAGRTLSPGQREQLRAAVVTELRARGSFDWNGLRYSVNTRGEIKRGLPW